MSEITPFQFPATGQHVRVLGNRDRPLIHHGDACKILQHTNPSVAIRMVDDDERVLIDLREISADQTALNFSYPATGNAKAWFLTEAGFYSLAFASKAKGAQAFRRWVTHEVLPAIRRTGTYTAAPALPELPQSHAEALRALADEVEAHERTKRRADALAAPAEAWNVLADASGDYSVREAAQILDRDPSISTGQNRLFASLREFGWTDRKGIPYQEHVDLGRLVQRPTSYTHPHRGEPVLTSQIRITAKGVEALRQLLGGGEEGGYLFAVPGSP